MLCSTQFLKNLVYTDDVILRNEHGSLCSILALNEGHFLLCLMTFHSGWYFKDQISDADDEHVTSTAFHWVLQQECSNLKELHKIFKAVL